MDNLLPLCPHDALAMGIGFNEKNEAGFVMSHCLGDVIITAHAVSADEARNIIAAINDVLVKIDRHNSGVEVIDTEAMTSLRVTELPEIGEAGLEAGGTGAVVEGDEAASPPSPA